MLLIIFYKEKNIILQAIKLRKKLGEIKRSGEELKKNNNPSCVLKSLRNIPFLKETLMLTSGISTDEESFLDSFFLLFPVVSSRIPLVQQNKYGVYVNPTLKYKPY